MDADPTYAEPTDADPTYDPTVHDDPMSADPTDQIQYAPTYGDEAVEGNDVGLAPLIGQDPQGVMPGNEGAMYTSYPEESQNSAKMKSGAFMVNTDAPITRQQAVEYINLQRWAREGCTTFMFVWVLWLSFLGFVYEHSHIEASYEMFREVTGEVHNLNAKESRGIAPEQIFSAAGQSMCSCSCPALCGVTNIGGTLPGVPGGAYLMEGTVLPEQLQLMRAKANYLKSINDHYADNTTEKVIQLHDVNSISNVWFWLQRGMVPELWHEEQRSNPVNSSLLFADNVGLEAARSALPPEDKPGHFMRWNQVIGGVRLRQRRLSIADCRSEVTIAGNYKQLCHRARPSVVPFGLGRETYAEGFVSSEEDKGAFDIYLDTQRPVHMALETLEFMLEANDWIDASTTSLQVQVALLNVEAVPAMFGILEVRFEFTRSGDLTKHVNLWTAAANPYPGFSLSYVPDIAFIGFLTYLFVKKIYQAIVYKIRRRERHDVLCNFFYIFDWATILSGFFGIALWFNTVQETTSIGEAITSLPAVPAYDDDSVTIKNYHTAWGDILDRIDDLTSMREKLRLAGFGYSMVLIFQFMKAFRGQPKLAQLSRTLIDAFEDLTHFVACFIVLFLTFAFTAHLVYGLRLEEWSNSTKCVNAAFRALRGDVDLTAMYDIAPFTTVVWFWAFLVVNIFVMMNLLLATVYDHYQIVKGKANAFTGILLQAKDAIKDVWNREGVKMFCCSCCCRCRRRQGYPTHSEMLEALMMRAHYGPKQRHFVFRTVLGPKRHRKKTEKHVFAGEIPADEIKDMEQHPVLDDFKEEQFTDDGNNVDQDYYQALLEDCENYREREFDPEEIHVAQMRELVTLCEIEMAYMRERLDKCQGHLRFSMHTLANRVHHVDEVVHQSLQSLHFLAGSAGVPSKKPVAGVSDPKSVAHLKHTYQRVMQHLGQGPVQKLQDDRKEHQIVLSDLVNARSKNDTYSRIHTNARLANAFGTEDKERVAEAHNMTKYLGPS
jgi:hypothetical protein